MKYQYVEINPSVCSGQPVLAGTRIPVTIILDRLEAGNTIAEILKNYPELQADQITGAIRFCRNLVGQTELEAVLG